MAFEALNDAAHSANDFIVILNDNEMSINKNVGGLALYLSKLRNSPSYQKANFKVKSWLDPYPKFKKMVTYCVEGLKSPLSFLCYREDFLWIWV